MKQTTLSVYIDLILQAVPNEKENKELKVELIWALKSAYARGYNNALKNERRF